MSKPIFTVIKSGLLTTIQDDGRGGYQSLGIPVSGVMDTFSHRVANILVGNRLHAAVLEITLVGPHLYVENDVVISICGANLSPKINGIPVPMWTSLYLKRGDLLTFGKNISGARAYVSVAGEFAIPSIFGSQSTELKTKMGGYFGRPIQKGDRLYINESRSHLRYQRRRLKPDDIPEHSKAITAHVILGPHFDYFTKESMETLLTESYTVSMQSDRMGYRLEGSPITIKNKDPLRSEATAFGSIQVPPSGKPIILMADRQTTGGYPIIGTIISVDLPKVAQAVPGTKVSFVHTTVEEAQAQFQERESWFYLLEKFYKEQ